MATTGKKRFVKNIRYGSLPVRKVYLGGRVVWQCVDVAGDAESSSFAQALFYLPILNTMQGSRTIATSDHAAARMLEIEVMVSHEEYELLTKAKGGASKILETKSEAVYSTFTSSIGHTTDIEEISAFLNEHVVDDTIVRPLDAELSRGILSMNTNEVVFGRMIISKNTTSKVDIEHDTSAVAGVSTIISTGGKIVVDLESQSKGSVADSTRTSSDTVSKLFVTTVAGAGRPQSTRGVAESTSYADPIVRVFDVIYTGGNVSESSIADAVCTLFDNLLMGGDTSLVFDNKAMMTKERAVLSKSSTGHSTSGDSFISKQFVIYNNGDFQLVSHGSASPVLWYPPIGDGIPLVEGQVEIPNYGQILEIQQAYQITIDHENGILEIDINNENEKLEVS